RAVVARGRRVAGVGAGFMGAEVAASCRRRGLEVVMIDPLPTPLAVSVGTEIGAVVGALHRDHGVVLRMGVGVAGFEGGARLERVRLSDGSAVPADVAVVGIGVAPCTEWLRSSRIALPRGVLCHPPGAAG